MYLAQTFSSMLHTYLYTHVFHFLQLTWTETVRVIHCVHTIAAANSTPCIQRVSGREVACAHFSADPVPSQEWRPQSLDLQEDMRKLLRIFMAVPPLCLGERESNTFLVSQSLH